MFLHSKHLSLVYDYGEEDDLSTLWLFIVILSSAITNIFNKRFINQTKVSILHFGLFCYLFALIGSLVIFVGESYLRFGKFEYPIFTLIGLNKAEEIINIIVLNSVNEVFNFVLMIYLAQKTFVTRASVYGILSSLFVIFEGIIAGRIGMDEGVWYYYVGTWAEIVLFLSSYSMIFFERIKNRNIAKFKKKLQVQNSTKFFVDNDKLTR